jgi:CRP-like cAMP-binding protein
VVLKKLFGGGDRKTSATDEASTIEDLIVLERYDEAVDRLKARLKLNPDDLHGHLRLAEAYLGLEERGRALDEFVFVAEEYARDGFYDRGIALLGKAKRFAPADGTLDEKIELFRIAKASEHSRSLAVEGLREGRGGATAAIGLERLWHQVAGSALVRELQPEVLRRLFSVFDILTLEEKQVLARAGDTGERLFFLLEGVIRVIEPDEDVERVDRVAGLRDFGPGDVIGESVLLEKKAWPATYVAIEECRVFALDREGLEKALQGNPDPRGFLTTLRMQHNDRQVGLILSQLQGQGGETR